MDIWGFQKAGTDIFRRACLCLVVFIPILAHLERLSSANGDHVYLGIVRCLKVGQDVGQQSRVLGAGGGRQDEMLCLCQRPVRGKRR